MKAIGDFGDFGNRMHFMYLEEAIIDKTLHLFAEILRTGKGFPKLQISQESIKPICPKIGVNCPEISYFRFFSHFGNNTQQCSTPRSKTIISKVFELHFKRVPLLG